MILAAAIAIAVEPAALASAAAVLAASARAAIAAALAFVADLAATGGGIVRAEAGEEASQGTSPEQT